MSTAGTSQAGGSASLDDVLQQITTSNNPSTLNHYLKTFAPKESRDTILASTLSSGQDPLSVLDPQSNTLGYLYILYVPQLRTHSVNGHTNCAAQLRKTSLFPRAYTYAFYHRRLLQPV